AEAMPVFGTIASHFNDHGVTALYQALLQHFNENNLYGNKDLKPWQTQFENISSKITDTKTFIVPPDRVRYLAEIVNAVKNYQQRAQQQANIARKIQQLQASKQLLQAQKKSTDDIEQLLSEHEDQLTATSKKLLKAWPQLYKDYCADEYIFHVRDREVRTKLFHESLAGLKIPKVALPHYEDDGMTLLWLQQENLPGYFPYTAGVYPFKRESEDPGRMFAGEGDAFRTNRRFKLLSEHSEAKRLSTAFDSVTLYGFDPAERPDIYGKVGNAGVSIATIDDMKALYAGFDLT
ncbi:unnamed protein product, partial [marine sediment metagenome]